MSPGLCALLLPHPWCPALLPEDSPHTQEQTCPKPHHHPAPDICSITSGLPKRDTGTNTWGACINIPSDEEEIAKDRRKGRWKLLDMMHGIPHLSVPSACNPPFDKPISTDHNPRVGVFEMVLTTDQLFFPLTTVLTQLSYL